MQPARRFLPDPLTTLHWLVDQVNGFGSREDVGLQSGLIERMVRSYLGDPITEVPLTSAGPSSPTGLPNQSAALAAILHVSGNDIYYRTDGLPPNPAGDNLVTNGSIITLTGQRTLTAFQFASTSAATATVYCTFYT